MRDEPVCEECDDGGEPDQPPRPPLAAHDQPQDRQAEPQRHDGHGPLHPPGPHDEFEPAGVLCPPRVRPVRHHPRGQRSEQEQHDGNDHGLNTIDNRRLLTEHMALVASVHNLSKIYCKPGTSVEVAALRSVNLDFVEGEYTAIMGASGSGKSTLMNLIGCLDRPTSGQYILGGEDVSQLDDDKLSEIR